MIGRKNIKTSGKINLSQFFQELKEGDRVAIVREHSFNPSFPKRIQGLSGVITGKKGKAYILKVKDGNESKNYIINAIHLKKII